MPVKFHYIWIGSEEIPLFRWLAYPGLNQDVHVYAQFLNNKSNNDFLNSPGKKIFYSGEFVMDEMNANVVVRFMPSNTNEMRAIVNINVKNSADLLICDFKNADRPNTKYIQLRLQELDAIEYKVKKYINQNLLLNEPKPIYDFLCHPSNILPYAELVSSWVQNKSNFAARTKPCLFMVTNHRNKIRNEIFFLLSRTIKVDSGGQLYNNLGKDDPKPPKREDHDEYIKYLSQYKFMITFENKSLPHYHTEKISNAFEAGVVPIYWGDPHITDVYDARSFIHIKTYDNPNRQWQEVKDGVKRVLAALENPAIYAEYFKYPPIKPDAQKREDERVFESLKAIATELATPL